MANAINKIGSSTATKTGNLRKRRSDNKLLPKARLKRGVNYAATCPKEVERGGETWQINKKKTNEYNDDNNGH